MESFRFGYQLTSDTAPAENLRSRAQAAEAAGFDVIHTSDHVGPGWGPLTTLVALAEATESLRVGPLVLNNDFHHPVLLAQEISAIDHLTGGRIELGIGAGHAFTEYAAIGLPFDPPAVRKSRLAESVEILRLLLDGQEVTFAGEHYQLEGVRTKASLQARLPILVGVNGRTALAHAARHADIVGLTMLGRTKEDGQHHEVRWEADRLDRTVDHIWTAAGGRDPAPQLQALVQAVVITDDRRAEAGRFAERLQLRVDDVLTTPFLCIGSHDEIAEHLLACRQRWGIDYFTVRDVEAFGPVVERLAI